MISLLVRTDETDELSPGGPCLNIADYNLDELERVAASGGVLYWDHLGAVRKVPNAVVRFTLGTYKAYQQWHQRGRPISQPSEVGLIWRDQTMPTPASEATLSALPHLDRQPQQPRGSSR